MNWEAIFIGLAKAAPHLVEALADAINQGDTLRARDLAEELARRQAFEARQRAKRGGK